MILCDIGNSFYHFWQNDKSYKISVNEPSKLPRNEIINFISVNENASKELEKFNKVINLANFVNFNTTYQGLGIDRIFACLNIENGVVIDAGSAITIDVMEDTKHLGGIILLGLNSHKRNYNQISSKLNFDLNKGVDLNSLPQNTLDAISYATLKSIILIINEIAKDKKLIFTGGDGKFLSKFFKNSTYDKDLIFNSMVTIIIENNLNNQALKYFKLK